MPKVLNIELGRASTASVSGIVGVFLLAEEPVLGVGHAGREADVLEKLEVRKADAEVVGHSVLHLVEEVGLAEIGGLEAYLVLQRGVVAEGYLFVEPLLADPVLPLEGVDGAHREGDVGQGEGIGGVAGVLAVHRVDAQVELAVPVPREGDGRLRLVLEGVVDVVGVVAVVRRAGEVHRGAEVHAGVGLGILRVRPLDGEVPGLEEFGSAPLAGLVVGVADRERAVELVVDAVAGVDVDGPRAKGVVVSGHGEVEVVAEHEVHAGVAHEESAGRLLAEGGHQHARGSVGPLGDEAERQAEEGYLHVLDHHVGRTEDGLLRGLLYHLGAGQREIVVGVVGVADRVFALGDVDGLVVHHLYVLSVEYAVVLGGDHVGDAGLARVEVVAHLLHVVGLASLGHFGLPPPRRGRWSHTRPRVDRALVHVVLHVFGGQLHVLVGHAHVAIIIYEAFAVAEVLDYGVPGGRERGLVEGTLAEHGHRVGPVQGVGGVERIPEGQGRGVGRDHLLLHAHAVAAFRAPLPGASALGLDFRHEQQESHQEGKYISELSQKRYISYLCVILQN